MKAQKGLIFATKKAEKAYRHSKKQASRELKVL
jgi:hypothetical protein